MQKQNEEELTRLMTSPVRAKMQISAQKLGDSQASTKTTGSTVSKTTLMVGTQNVTDGQASSWQGK